jgi:hypothetical protein
MKRSIALVVGALCISTAQAATFVVEVNGVVQNAFGTSGGVLDAAQIGEAVTETFVFDTDRFPQVIGDGATTLGYLNPYLSPVDAVRSRFTVGGRVFNVDGYPLLREGASALDSFVIQLPPGFPPPPPNDGFAVSDASATVALNVAGARGLTRSAFFTALAPGASSLVTVPLTSLSNVHLGEATLFNSSLIEGIGLALSSAATSFDPATARQVLVSVQSATLRRCEHRLRWLDAGQPWPKHGVRCETDGDEDDDGHDQD